MTDAPPASLEPLDHFVVANGLRHHVVEWRPASAAAPTSDSQPPVWLAHGFMDFAYSWTRVAERIASAGYRVFAHDWRGHGETDWIGPGGYYHFADYALDLEVLLPHFVDGPVHLVGHSMGATATALFAGVRSARLASLALIEGLGPPRVDPSTVPARFGSWFDSVARVRAKQAQRDKDTGSLEDVEAALQRMCARNRELAGEHEAWGRFLAEKATRPTADGRRVWRFDPLHRTISPIPFRLDQFMHFLSGIAVPTLVVFGEKGYRLPKVDEDARLAAIRDHKVLEIADAGHMIPWFNDEVFVGSWLRHVEA